MKGSVGRVGKLPTKFDMNAISTKVRSESTEVRVCRRIICDMLKNKKSMKYQVNPSGSIFHYFSIGNQDSCSSKVQ